MELLIGKNIMPAMLRKNLKPALGVFMTRFAVTMAVIVGCTMMCWGQAYYEASGQTEVFTLAAGATAGPASIRAVQAPPNVPVFDINIFVARSGVVVTMPSLMRRAADISIYNISGRQIYQQPNFSGKTLRLEARKFKPGIYVASVCIDGKIFARRFALAGRGE